MAQCDNHKGNDGATIQIEARGEEGELVQPVKVSDDRETDADLAFQLEEEEKALIAARAEQEKRDEELAREFWREETAKHMRSTEPKIADVPKRYCMRCGIEGPNVPRTNDCETGAGTSTTTVSFWRDGPAGPMSLCQNCGVAFEASTGQMRQEWVDWGIAVSLLSCEDDVRGGGSEDFMSTEEDSDDESEDEDEDADSEHEGIPQLLPPASSIELSSTEHYHQQQRPQLQQQQQQRGDCQYGNVFQRGSSIGCQEHWMEGGSGGGSGGGEVSNAYRNAPADVTDMLRRSNEHMAQPSKRNAIADAEDLERFLEENVGKKRRKRKHRQTDKSEEDESKKQQGHNKKRKRQVTQQQHAEQRNPKKVPTEGPEGKKRRLGEGEGEGEEASGNTNQNNPSTTKEEEDGDKEDEDTEKLSDSVENISFFGSGAAINYFAREPDEGDGEGGGGGSMYKATTEEQEGLESYEEENDSDEDDEDNEDGDEEDDDDEDDDEEEDDEDEDDDEEDDEVGNEEVDDTSLDSMPDSDLALDFSGDVSLTDIGTLSLPNALKGLNLSRTGVSGQSFDRLPRNLGRLRMAHCSAVDDHSLLHIPSSLHTLDLAFCKITAMALLLLPQRLHTLVLSGCTYISNASLQQLPRTLASLDLSGCDQLTEEGLRHLPSGLQTLKLNGCKGVNDFLLMRQYLPSGLTSLYLARCENVSDEGLPFLPSSLQTLDLSHNSNVSDDGLAALKCLKALSYLYAHGRVRCDSLKRLVLKGCPRVTGKFASELSNVSLVLKDSNHHHVNPYHHHHHRSKRRKKERRKERGNEEKNVGEEVEKKRDKGKEKEDDFKGRMSEAT